MIESVALGRSRGIEGESLNNAASGKRRGRPPGKRTGPRRTPQANAVKAESQRPWNKPGEMKLHLCESVRQQLPVWSPYR